MLCAAKVYYGRCALAKLHFGARVHHAVRHVNPCLSNASVERHACFALRVLHLLPGCRASPAASIRHVRGYGSKQLAQIPRTDMQQSRPAEHNVTGASLPMGTLLLRVSRCSDCLHAVHHLHGSDYWKEHAHAGRLLYAAVTLVQKGSGLAQRGAEDRDVSVLACCSTSRRWGSYTL